MSKSLSAALLFGMLATVSAGEDELRELKVLYVGSERASAYVGFLSGKVAKFEAKSREAFEVRDAAAFDVVLLDWPQGEETREMRKLKSPLGARDEWEKPTVLLGSAGLHLAVAWKLKGGSGCTCMDPLAYDLREHRIFDTPFKIDRGKMISIPTPDGFQERDQGARDHRCCRWSLIKAVAGGRAGAHTREISRCIRMSNSFPAESIIRPRRRPDSGGRATCCTLVLNNRRPK